MNRMLSTLAVVSAFAALAACNKREPVTGPSGDAATSAPGLATSPASDAGVAAGMGASTAAPMDSSNGASAPSGAASAASAP